VVEFLARPDIKEKHGITKNISQSTARRYLKTLGYRFMAPRKGQYADGHEREDVVWYRDHRFLPAWHEIQDRMHTWTKDNLPEVVTTNGKRVIVWFHDEVIFYAHDRRKKAWYHKDAAPKPYVKGEGASLMIADFVSADFGWLQSPDRGKNARRVMKPGKNRDGYFTSEDITEQANAAMDILTEHYPEYEHIFVYDNAPSHLKRPEGSVTARNMPKYTPKPGTNWGIEVSKRDVNGNLEYNTDGSIKKHKIPMQDSMLTDGTVQPLYFPEGHERAGVFKGMAVILEERGFAGMQKLRAECKNFKCAPPALDCCCRRLLFNQPDFQDVDTILGAACEARSFQLIFLLKFHCELNFIEQCWGYAKRLYRLNPESSREDHLERNALAALDVIRLVSMRWLVLQYLL
jgi:transposase